MFSELYIPIKDMCYMDILWMHTKIAIILFVGVLVLTFTVCALKDLYNAMKRKLGL